MKVTFKSVFAAGLVLLLLSSCSRTEIKDTARERLRGTVKLEQVNTGIPVVHINTAGGVPITTKGGAYINADITITDPNNADNNIETTTGIRGRGNTTWTHPKKPYRLKFDEKISLFGLEKAKSWVLLANYQDPTLIMNTVAFELGHRFGLPFTNHYNHVEVILNGVYQGSYVLTEQVQVNKGRVDIDEKTGFFLELDRYYDDEPKFRSAILGLPVMIKSPEGLSGQSSYAFIIDAVNELEAALFADSFPNNNYRDLIDIDIFIDYVMINEILKNVDLQMPGSVYMYRDGTEGARIGMGPLWDFDYGFNGAGEYFKDATGMFYNTVYREGPGGKFFNRFFEDPDFRVMYKARWNEKYADIASMESFIEKMGPMLEKSSDLNSKVWWWNKVNYLEEIGKMKTWWKNRVEYLNTEINQNF
ncbi:CotH kinase family protein [Breznakiella homolactica]|uniref:CotH kinase family protein n=1 Tax=Breznakiella homolactica TaxID=2798577 RepID=A0A7T7XNM5_9SPIR|nr:CotH kinase family protein [Breznakiella homolactica]QQO09623.1 CotH kinase family protein [Breznakiella homolactica]